MIWLKMAPLFLGITLLGIYTMVRPGAGTPESGPFVFERNRVSSTRAGVKSWNPAPCTVPVEPVLRMTDFAHVPLPPGPSAAPETDFPGDEMTLSPSYPSESASPWGKLRYEVRTARGTYLFHDLETALAFALPDEWVVQEGGGPAYLNGFLADFKC